MIIKGERSCIPRMQAVEKESYMDEYGHSAIVDDKLYHRQYFCDFILS